MKLLIVVLFCLIVGLNAEDPPSYEENLKMSYKAIADLTPHRIWHKFLNVSRIPRPSDEEGQGFGRLVKIQEFLMNFAEKEGVVAKKDKIGNIVMVVPATKGYESASPIILQSHVDQVPAKDVEYNFDFEKDSILLQKEEDPNWITAYKTTLGADDGMGVAAELAIIEERDMFNHPKLFCLFTVDEETTMAGIRNLGEGSELHETLKEAKLYLNLDSETMGEVVIGSAGGQTAYISSEEVRMETTAFSQSYEISIKGLQGGHSGVDIHFERASAIDMFAQIIVKMFEEEVEFSISDIQIGEKQNSIPNKGTIVFNFEEKNLAKVKEIMNAVYAYIEKVYGSVEVMSQVELNINKVETTKLQIPQDQIVELTKLIYLLPAGVIRMMHDESLSEPLVETSTNLASVRLEQGKINVVEFTRSSVAESVLLVQNKIDVIAATFDFANKRGEIAPSWKPSPTETRLQKLTKDIYKKLTGGEMKALALHAGLECAFIVQNDFYPGIDVVSIGPTIQSPHTTRERVNVKSVAQFYDLVKGILENLK